MAFNMFAKLHFSAPGAKSTMGAVEKSFRRLKRSATQVGQGFTNLGAGVRSAALATAPAALFTGAAIKQAGAFEHQMQAVQSIVRTTPEMLAKVGDEMKFLGATTIFTAKEAARGAQLFGQAGFTAQETIAGMRGVLDAAAAGEIGVAAATNLVASSVRAFSLEAKDAGQVANILAETSALTNTNMTELGEGLKLSSAKAKGLGLSLSQTAAAIGVISNVGVKGTLAGTALRNALQKLSKPSKETTKLFGDLGVIVNDTGGNLLPFGEIFNRLNQAIGKSPNKLESARKAAELFGIRGEVAFGAFRDQANETLLVTDKNLARLRAGLKNSNSTFDETKLKVGNLIPKLVALDFLIDQSAGSAEKMAATRLDSFFGQLKLMTSAFNNLQLEIGSLFLDDFADGVRSVTNAISVLTLGFRSLTMDPKQIADFTARMEKSGNKFLQFLPMAQEFARGFIEGFNEVRAVVRSVFDFIVEKFQSFKSASGLTSKDVGKLVAKFLLFGAMAAPILAGIAAAMFVIGPMVMGVIGVFQILGGALGIIGTIVGGVFTAITSFGGAIMNTIGVLKFLGFAALLPFIKVILIIAAVIAIVVVFRDRFIKAITEAVGFFMPQIMRVKDFFLSAFGQMGTGSGEIWNNIKTIATNVWGTIMAVIGGAVNFILTLWTGMMFIWSSVFEGLLDIALPILNTLFQSFKTLGADIGLLFSEIGVLFSEVGGIIGDVWTQVFGGAGGEMLTFKEIVMGVAKVIGTVLKFIMKGISIFLQAIIIPLFAAAVTGIKLLIGIIRLVVRIITAVVTTIRSVINAIGDGFNAAGDGIREKFGSVFGFITEAVNIFSQGKKEGGVFAGLVQAATFVKDAVVGVFETMFTKVIGIISGLMKRVKNAAVDVGKSTINSIGGFLNSINPFSKDENSGPLAGSQVSFGQPKISKAVEGASEATKSANAANQSSKTTQAVITAAPLANQTNKINESAKESKSQPIVVNSTLNCDGQQIARAVSKSQVENSERQGQEHKCFKRGLVERAPSAAGAN